MYYIQRKDKRTIETVDETVDYREAVDLVIWHRAKDNSARYYISQRPTKAWRDKCTTQ